MTADDYKQKVLAIIATVISLWVIWNLSLYARSSFYVSEAKREVSLYFADKSIEITPNSADAYYERGRIFEKRGETERAIADFEQSLNIRPNDYFVWLQLGLARQRKNDAEGAVNAFRESVRLAPFYGLPHWHLGKILHQTEHREEGWAEIRKAAASDPTLLLRAIDLAWMETGGSAPEMENLLPPETQAHALVLGIFLLEKGATLDAARFLCHSKVLPAGEQQALIARLVKRQEFRLALTVEAGDCSAGQDNSVYSGKIKNGSFENEIALVGGSFDWQLNAAPKNFQILIDKSQFFDGSRSLEVNFKGDVAAGEPILKQLLPVESGVRYRLSFAFKTGDLVTDSRPLLEISDAAAPTKNIAVSNPFKNEANWAKTEIDFETSEQTEAVWLRLVREPCHYRSCPIFGTIWLDAFELKNKS